MGCTGNAGVCGKQADTAGLQDKLTGALIGLARATEGNESLVTPEIDRLVLEGLFTTVTNVSFNNEPLNALIERVEQAKASLIPQCGVCESQCGRNDDYDMQDLWQADEDIRSLKSLILFGIRGMAAYAYHAAVLGFTDKEVSDFFYKALFAIGMKDFGMDELLPIVLEVGAVNLKCMALLDRANTQTFGTPEPTQVSLTVEKGPFIVISGHDLYDLKQLLEQPGTRASTYTPTERCSRPTPTGAEEVPHLKGNFGTAWQNQQKEFADLPAPVLFTTNCLMPPRPGYADRVFTTEVVSYPEIRHIGPDKDFSPVIEKPLRWRLRRGQAHDGHQRRRNRYDRLRSRRGPVRCRAGGGGRQGRRHPPLLPGGRL
jgi:hydroxylamine reductase